MKRFVSDHYFRQRYDLHDGDTRDREETRTKEAVSS